MTLATSTRYKKYSPVSSTDTFLVTFPVFDTDDLRVFVDSVEDLTFSVTATFTDGRSDDANVVLTAGVSGVDVEIFGSRDPRRENDVADNAPNVASRLQQDMDAVVAIQQEQVRDLDRFVRLPVESGVSRDLTADVAARSGKFLGFDSNGEPVVGTPSGSGTVVTSYSETLLAAATEAAWRGILNVPSDTEAALLGGTQTFTGINTFENSTNFRRDADVFINLGSKTDPSVSPFRITRVFSTQTTNLAIRNATDTANVSIVGFMANGDVDWLSDGDINIAPTGEFQYGGVKVATVDDNPVKAWVNFDGTGTPTIRAGSNVASITDNGAGHYTVNFTDPLPDADYAVSVTTDRDASDQNKSDAALNLTVNGFDIKIRAGRVLTDATTVMAVVVR